MRRWIIILALTAAAAFPLAAKAVSPDIDSLIDEATLAHDTAQARLFNNIAARLNISDPGKAVQYANMSIKIAKKNEQNRQLADAYLILGKCYLLLNDYVEAVKSFEEERTVRTILGDDDGLAGANTNLARIFTILEDPDKAMYYVEELRKIVGPFAFINTFIKQDIVASYHICYGRVCTLKGEFDTAYTELNTALRMYEKMKMPKSIILATSRLLAELQALSGDTTSAINTFNAIIADSTFIHRASIAEVYNSLANIYLNRGLYSGAEKHAKEALEIAESISDKQKMESIYGTMGKICYYRRNYAKAAEWFERKLKLSDEIYGYEISQKLISAKTTAEATRKDLEIKSLEKEQSLQDTIYTVMLIFVSTILVMLIVFIVYSRMTKRLHSHLDVQKKKLDESTTKITSSLVYARYIQQSAVSSPESVAEIFPDSFVWYNPRDIVSGDWYRVESRRGLNIIVEADCTGHGVPGALLSMMGMSALKDILNNIDHNNADFDPAEMLTRMRIMVKAILMQHPGDGFELTDGMDMTIGVIDPATNTMRFGSAYQNAILIRDGECVKIKGDRQPIGNYIREKEFTSQTIQLQKGDALFFMSDGIKDQLNPQMEKFKSNRLDQLLLDNIQLPMPEIKEKIHTTIEAWRDGIMQVDDMTIVGVRI